jgi:hypothetical protein
LGSTTLLVSFCFLRSKRKKERKKERKEMMTTFHDQFVVYNLFERFCLCVCHLHILAQRHLLTLVALHLFVWATWEEEAPFLSIDSIWRMSKVVKLWNCFFFFLALLVTAQINNSIDKYYSFTQKKRGGFELGIHHSIISETSQQSPQH